MWRARKLRWVPLNPHPLAVGHVQRSKPMAPHFHLAFRPVSPSQTLSVIDPLVKTIHADVSFQQRLNSRLPFSHMRNDPWDRHPSDGATSQPHQPPQQVEVRDKHSLSYSLRDMHGHGNRETVIEKHPSGRPERKVRKKTWEKTSVALNFLISTACCYPATEFWGVRMVCVRACPWMTSEDLAYWDWGDPRRACHFGAIFGATAGDSRRVSIVWSSLTGCSPSTSPPPDSMPDMHRWACTGEATPALAPWRCGEPVCGVADAERHLLGKQRT